MLVEPLGNAVSTKEVRAAGELWAASDHMDLADLADEPEPS